jgi:lipoyl(octanoyl) transferase
MLIQDLGRLDYRTAWKFQEEMHDEVRGGHDERLLLVEHPPVITFGRRPGTSRHVLATPDQLKARNIETIESDRGGDITFHGPGQVVIYPIFRLADHGLSISGYVHTLEKIIIRALAEFGIEGHADPEAVGVWVKDGQADDAAKIAAIGVRIRRGVSLHGLALNVSTDLSFFDLIVPCGLSGRRVTSLQKLLPSPPTMLAVQEALIRQFQIAFAE